MPRAVTARSPLRRRGVASTSFFRRASPRGSNSPLGASAPSSARLDFPFPLRASFFEIIGSLPAPIRLRRRIDKKTLPAQGPPGSGLLRLSSERSARHCLAEAFRLAPLGSSLLLGSRSYPLQS